MVIRGLQRQLKLALEVPVSVRWSIVSRISVLKRGKQRTLKGVCEKNPTCVAPTLAFHFPSSLNNQLSSPKIALKIDSAVL